MDLENKPPHQKIAGRTQVCRVHAFVCAHRRTYHCGDDEGGWAPIKGQEATESGKACCFMTIFEERPF